MGGTIYFAGDGTLYRNPLNSAIQYLFEQEAGHLNRYKDFCRVQTRAPKQGRAELARSFILVLFLSVWPDKNRGADQSCPDTNRNNTNIKITRHHWFAQLCFTAVCLDVLCLFNEARVIYCCLVIAWLTKLGWFILLLCVGSFGPLISKNNYSSKKKMLTLAPIKRNWYFMTWHLRNVSHTL